jgi:acetylglutamate kinase
MTTGHAAPDSSRVRIAGTMGKAAILMEALPYIQAFKGRTVVIKYGGSAMVDAALRHSFAGDVTLLATVGIRPVVVHGGGPQITAAMVAAGLEPVFVDGLRVTDDAAIRVVQRVLAGEVNPDIVRLLRSHQAAAVGLTGLDGGMIEANPRDARLGYVAEVSRVDTGLLDTMIGGGFIPVVAPLARGEDGALYNVNADIVAGQVAAALGAEKLVYLTDVEGLYRHLGDEGSLISSIALTGVEEMLERGEVAGGMLPKLRSCVAAMSAGVGRAHILDGRVQHALLLEIFTPEGIGTMVEHGQPT